MNKLFSSTIFQIIMLLLFASGFFCVAFGIMSKFETDSLFHKLKFFGFVFLINIVLLALTVIVGVLLEVFHFKKK